MNYLHFHLLIALRHVTHPLVSALQESPPSALPFLVVSRHIWHVQLDFDLPCEPGRNITSSLKLMQALIDS